MEIKKYIDDLNTLTEAGLIKWTRRAMGELVFDAKIGDMHVVSLYHEMSMNRITMVVTHDISSTGFGDLDIHGQIYKSISKLWDTVVTHNLTKVVDTWHAELPKLPLKLKHLGPKELKELEKKNKA